MLLVIGAAVVLIRPLLRTPDIEGINFADLALECARLIEEKGDGRALADYDPYPEIRKLRPVGIDVYDDAVLLRLGNRRGVRCRQRSEDGAWVFEVAGDMSTYTLGIVPPLRAVHDGSNSRASGLDSRPADENE